MKRVSRTSTAGARYLDLQREARRTGRPTDELIQLYALECFLDRVKDVLTDRVRKIARRRLDLILAGIDIILGR